MQSGQAEDMNRQRGNLARSYLGKGLGDWNPQLNSIPSAQKEPGTTSFLQAACLPLCETFVTLGLSEQEGQVSVLRCIAKVAAAKFRCARHMESNITRPIQ